MRVLFYRTVQYLLFLLTVPFVVVRQGALRLTGHPLMWLNRAYYWSVVARRRVLGEPEWQEHDWMLGICPPKDHPAWKDIPTIPLGPDLAAIRHEQEP